MHNQETTSKHTANIMAESWQRFINEWDRLSDEVSKLHKDDFWVSSSLIRTRVLPTIAAVAVLLTLIYVLALSALPKMTTPIRRFKACYQIVNAIFNLSVGIVGIYQEYWILPTLPCFGQDSILKIAGNASELYHVSAMQLGYQLWALPVGIWHVAESKEMLMHHIAVVVVTSCSGFLNLGFRYYTPYFYGIMELSSLPLTMMNVFKDNKEWIEKYPKVYLIIRGTFSVSFLFIRVYMCAFRWPIFLRDNFLVFWTSDMGLVKLYFLIQWSLASFLAYLQLFWAVLVVKGMLKVLLPNKKKLT